MHNGFLLSPITRTLGKIEIVYSENLQVIPDTLFIEVLPYNAPSNQLFRASEKIEKTRQTWFASLGISSLSDAKD